MINNLAYMKKLFLSPKHVNFNVNKLNFGFKNPKNCKIIKIDIIKVFYFNNEQKMFLFVKYCCFFYDLTIC